MTNAYLGAPRRRVTPPTANPPLPPPTVDDFRRRKERRTPPQVRAAGEASLSSSVDNPHEDASDR